MSNPGFVLTARPGRVQDAAARVASSLHVRPRPREPGDALNDVTLLILPEIREMADARDAEGLREGLAEVHAADIADVISNLEDAQAALTLEVLPEKQRVMTFEHLEEADQIRLVAALGREKMIRIIEEMSADDRADLIRTLPEATVESLLPLLAQAERNDARRLAAYEEGTAGSVMTTEYASLPVEMSVGDALARLRQVAPDKETIYSVFITDADRRLVGYTTLRELVLARPSQNIMEVRRHPLISMPVDADQEEVARALEHYDLIAVPIVDAENRLVGIVTHDDVIDVINQEATEDAQRMGAVEPLDTPYLRAGFWDLAWRRGAWLTMLFATTLISGMALTRYEGTLQQIISLVVFIPVIAAAGGNSGSQSATLIVRSLATGDVRLRDWLRVVRREAAMGLALGLLLGILGYLRAWWTGQSEMICLAVGLTLVGIVVAGSLTGAVLPLVFQGLRLDPGVASSPFVASVVDIVGIVLYFTVIHLLVPIPAS